MLATALGLLLVAFLILLPGVLLVVAGVLLVRDLRAGAGYRGDAARQGQTPGSQLDSPPPSPPWPLA